MTGEELDKYLESVGGLVNGWREDGEPIMSSDYFACCSGWYGIIKDLISGAIEAGWDRKILQVKEKFGGLRFYIGAASSEVHDLIRIAEDLSYKTCEICGSTENVVTEGRWLRTLCDKCRKKKENEVL